VTTRNDVKFSDELNELRARVKLTRQQRNLSHRQAGEQIGMAYADLCRFENGLKDPRLSTVQKLVAWLEDDPYVSESGVS
jgi:transcriptional regulator with XRE-family HTH domain